MHEFSCQLPIIYGLLSFSAILSHGLLLHNVGSCVIPPASVLLFDVEFIGKAWQVNLAFLTTEYRNKILFPLSSISVPIENKTKNLCVLLEGWYVVVTHQLWGAHEPLCFQNLRCEWFNIHIQIQATMQIKYMNKHDMLPSICNSWYVTQCNKCLKNGLECMDRLQRCIKVIWVQKLQNWNTNLLTYVHDSYLKRYNEFDWLWDSHY